jgi:hypothetical protein
MRKKQLIQLGILAIALISGYKFLESLISVIITVLYQFTYRFEDTGTIIIQYLILLAVYFAAFFLLVRYNKQIADYIDKQGNPGGNADAGNETIRLSIEQSSLLFIILIALCLITLIQEIPVLLLSIYNYFKKEAGSFHNGSPDDLNFKAAAIKFVFAMIILFSARSISAWFSKQSPSDKPLIETTGEPGETNSLNL